MRFLLTGLEPGEPLEPRHVCSTDVPVDPELPFAELADEKVRDPVSVEVGHEGRGMTDLDIN